MGLLDFIFGSKQRQVENYIKNDALILDVRTQREWDTGHINSSIHIPLNELNTRIGEILKLNKPIIACCASGVRSANATQVLKRNKIDAINGGSWKSVQSKL